jgi:hypothetical protein
MHFFRTFLHQRNIQLESDLQVPAPPLAPHHPPPKHVLSSEHKAGIRSRASQRPTRCAVGTFELSWGIVMGGSVRGGGSGGSDLTLLQPPSSPPPPQPYHHHHPPPTSPHLLALLATISTPHPGRNPRHLRARHCNTQGKVGGCEPTPPWQPYCRSCWHDKRKEPGRVREIEPHLKAGFR